MLYVYICIYIYVHICIVYVYTYTYLCGVEWPVLHILSPFPSSVLLRLKEAEEARTLCISIEGLECATELQTALTTHSSAMTNLYRDLHQLTSQEVNDLSKYQVLFDQATNYQSWFKTRKKVANTMKTAALKAAWSHIKSKLFYLTSSGIDALSLM